MPQTPSVTLRQQITQVGEFVSLLGKKSNCTMNLERQLLASPSIGSAPAVLTFLHPFFSPSEDEFMPIIELDSDTFNLLSSDWCETPGLSTYKILMERDPLQPNRLNWVHDTIFEQLQCGARFELLEGSPNEPLQYEAIFQKKVLKALCFDGCEFAFCTANSHHQSGVVAAIAISLHISEIFKAYSLPVPSVIGNHIFRIGNDHFLLNANVCETPELIWVAGEEA